MQVLKNSFDGCEELFKLRELINRKDSEIADLESQVKDYKQKLFKLQQAIIEILGRNLDLKQEIRLALVEALEKSFENYA